MFYVYYYNIGLKSMIARTFTATADYPHKLYLSVTYI